MTRTRKKPSPDPAILVVPLRSYQDRLYSWNPGHGHPHLTGVPRFLPSWCYAPWVFRDPDAIERIIGKSVDSMNPAELVTYVKASMKAAHDLRLPVLGNSERAVMARLQRTYGQRDAGLIIKWTLWKYGGKPNGTHITYNSFSKARKWQTDQWHLELQEHSKREATVSHSAEGFGLLKDL